MSYFDDLNEFTDEEIANNGVSSANDALEGSAAENKKVFDRLPKYIAVRINIIISSLKSFASSIDVKFTDLREYIDQNFLSKVDRPTKVSEFLNDTGFITDEAVPTKISELENDTGFVADEAVPKKLSELENDKDFTTKSYIDGLVGDIDAALGYILAIQDELISQSVNLAKDGE